MSNPPRKAVDLIRIGVTPPEAASHTAAARLNESLKRSETRLPVYEPTALALVPDLCRLPWLHQDRAYQAGLYLLTHGLQRHASHPELELCNVPGAFLKSAHELLNTLSDMVLAGSVFKHGETCMIEDAPHQGGPGHCSACDQARSALNLAVVGFREIRPGDDSEVPHTLPVLRVLFLR